MRERQVNIIVAAPGYGKSSLMAEIIKRFYKRENVLLFKKFMNINDPAFSFIPEKPFASYISGSAKFADNDATMLGKKPKEKYRFFLQAVLKSYRNGLLIVDDAGSYERYTTSDELNELVMMRRHMGVDVFYLFHSMSFLPIEMLPYTNNVIIGHTTDNFAYKAAKLPEMEKLIEAKERIAQKVASGNKYYKEVIKLS